MRCLCRAGPPGSAVEIVRPLEFGSGVAVSGFIEEATADLMSHQGFPNGCAGHPQRFFMQLGGFMPPVLPLVGMRENQQGPEPVLGVRQQQPTFRHGFLNASEHRKNPHTFKFRAVIKPALDHGPVQDNVTKGGRIHPPGLHFDIQ